MRDVVIYWAWWKLTPPDTPLLAGENDSWVGSKTSAGIFAAQRKIPRETKESRSIDRSIDYNSIRMDFENSARARSSPFERAWHYHELVRTGVMVLARFGSGRPVIGSIISEMATGQIGLDLPPDLKLTRGQNSRHGLNQYSVNVKISLNLTRDWPLKSLKRPRSVVCPRS